MAADELTVPGDWNRGAPAPATARAGDGRAPATRPRLHARPGRGLARGLGWFSVGLGVAQLVAPRRVARVIGVADDAEARTAMRLVGAREVVSGAGILASANPAPFVVGRVGGDLVDLALLTRAMDDEGASRGRLSGAFAAVAGVALLDLAASAMLASGDRGGVVEVRKAVTVRCSRQDAYATWRDLRRLPEFMTHLERVEERGPTSHWVASGPRGTLEWDAELVEDVPGDHIAWRSLPGASVDNAGWVWFTDAPAGQGTEVHVAMEVVVPGGPLGAAAGTLLGASPRQRVADDLLRFKQVMETGEVVVSEGSPEGARAARQLAQREARPLPA
jgi:uncharacterized membrane protein